MSGLGASVPFAWATPKHGKHDDWVICNNQRYNGASRCTSTPSRTKRGPRKSSISRLVGRILCGAGQARVASDSSSPRDTSSDLQAVWCCSDNANKLRTQQKLTAATRELQDVLQLAEASLASERATCNHGSGGLPGQTAMELDIEPRFPNQFETSMCRRVTFPGCAQDSVPALVHDTPAEVQSSTTNASRNPALSRLSSSSCQHQALLEVPTASQHYVTNQLVKQLAYDPSGPRARMSSVTVCSSAALARGRGESTPASTKFSTNSSHGSASKALPGYLDVPLYSYGAGCSSQAPLRARGQTTPISTECGTSTSSSSRVVAGHADVPVSSQGTGPSSGKPARVCSEATPASISNSTSTSSSCGSASKAVPGHSDVPLRVHGAGCSPEAAARACTTCSTDSSCDSAGKAVLGHADVPGHVAKEGPKEPEPSIAKKEPMEEKQEACQVPTKKPCGKAAPKARGPPPPPRQKAMQSTERTLPQWQGPQPPAGWRSERIVNWQPIRQQSRWQGSIWQQVYKSIEDGGSDLLSNEELMQAFMRRQEDNDAAHNTDASESKRQRALPSTAAFSADLRHAQLLRCGFHSAEQLSWVLGRRIPSTAQQQPVLPASQKVDATSPVQELSEEVVEAVAGLLAAANGYEHQLLEASNMAKAGIGELPPSEELLAHILKDWGPLQSLSIRVKHTLQILRFPLESKTLEKQLNLGIEVATRLVSSTALPVLLEGVLLLGNYVNSASSHLGAAVGVSLDSLAKLAHTKCLSSSGSPKNTSSSPQTPRQGSTGKSKNAPGDALTLLVMKLQEKRGPAFLQQLTSDLQGCREAQELELKQISAELQNLTISVHEIKQFGANLSEDDALDLSHSLTSACIGKFLTETIPVIEQLKALVGDLEIATEGMQRRFAEPRESSFQDMVRSIAALLPTLTAAKRPTTPAAASPPDSRTKRRSGKRRKARLRSAPPAFNRALSSGLSADLPATSRRAQSVPPTPCHSRRKSRHESSKAQA